MRSVPVVDAASIDIARAYEGITDFLLLDSYRANDRQIGALLGLGLVQAATACALVEIVAGRPIGAVAAYRIALRRIRPLAGASEALVLEQPHVLAELPDLVAKRVDLRLLLQRECAQRIDVFGNLARSTRHAPLSTRRRDDLQD